MGDRDRGLLGLVVVLAVVAGSTSGAQAAAVSTLAGDLGASVVTIGRCSATGLSVLPNVTVSSVVSATVATLPAACGNATLQLTVNNGVTNSSGSAVVPAGGGSVTVTLAVAVALTTQLQTDFVLVGP
jgi:hypothetical protein